MYFFAKGEKKVRPGIYGRYEDVTPVGKEELISVCACTVKSDWGPLGEVVQVTQSSDLGMLFGNSGTVSIIKEILAGKCQMVKVVRLGNGGEKGSITIENEASEEVLTLEMKYPGSREFAITIRESITNQAQKELVLYEGSKQINKVTFPSGNDEVSTLFDKISQSKNPWYTIKKVKDEVSGILPKLEQASIRMGEDPRTDDSEDYENALELLESDIWDVLCVDTNDIGIHALVKSYIDRIFYNGAMVMAVLGAPTGSFDARCQQAAGYNSHNIVYVGGSAYFGETLMEGFMAAARVAGMMCGYDSSQTLTRKEIVDATDVGEKITNEQYIEATKSGMLLFSKNRQGVVRIENAINTLVEPGETPEGLEDEGWKKIKRVLIRHELMNRIDMMLDAKISNSTRDILMDEDGIAEIKSTIFDVIGAMQNERKLHHGSATVDVDTSVSSPDSSAFIIAVDDIDSMEKIYITYCYRYQRLEEEGV